MAGLWEELLAPASLGGVELPVVSRRISGGRDFARKRLPYVGGQQVEDTGDQPRVLEVEVELFADMDEPDLYPDRYEDLVDVLRDDQTQAQVEWQDPVWGSIQVKVVTWSVEENSEDRDGARVSLQLEEVGFRDDLDVSVFSTSDRSRAGTDAAEFDALIDELAITGGEIETAWDEAGFPKKAGETTSFVDQINSFSRTLDSGFQRADQVQASTNVLQARVESVMRLPASRAALAWQVIDRGSRLLDSAAAMAEAVVSRQTRIVNYTTTGRLSVFEVANILYGDPSRAAEVMQANPSRNPLFFAAGTVLRVLET